MEKLLTNRPYFFYFLAVCIVCISYSNSFHASWHLDDEPNILTNPKLQLTDFSLKSFTDSITANPTAPESNKLYRPIPCITLAFNWYLSQTNILSYHIVNLLIHLLTTWFLFLTLNLLLHIYYKNNNTQLVNTTALLTALLWSLAPIQTQAVTYIIQRMASMAALFTILSIYSYLKGRTSYTNYKYTWFVFCLLSFFAALGSKVNTIILPASIVLIEITFIQHYISNQRMRQLITLSSIALAAGFLLVRFGFGIDPFNFLDNYGHRSFTFSERILTEPRIVVMYFTQTLLPIASRLSIEHDITLSTSLFRPWTTTPAIIFITTLIGLSIRYLRRYPIFTFPVLFFFLNHIVESTVIPLELIFEHRNYLPSFFLFLPIAFLVAQALYGPKKFSPFGRIAIMLCAASFLAISGYATYTRNMVWANEGTLWTDAIGHAPTSPRAAHNLGRWHRQFGQYEQARYYFQLALQNAEQAASPAMTKCVAFNGLASVSYMLGQYQQSLQYFDQCLKIDPDNEACLKNRSLAYLRLNMPEKALTDAIHLIERYPVPTEYRYTASMAAYSTGDLVTAQTYIEQIAGNSLDHQNVMHLTGLLLMQAKSYPNSLFFLKQAHKLAPDNINFAFALASAYLGNNDLSQAKQTINAIFAKHPLPLIQAALQKIKTHHLPDRTINFIKNEMSFFIKANMNHD